MKKLTLFAVFTVFTVLSGCSLSNLFGDNPSNQEKEICKIGSKDCEQTKTGTQKNNFEIIKGEYTGTQDDIQSTIALFDDLNTIDNSYGYLFKDAGKTDLYIQEGEKLIIKSGVIFLQKDGQETNLFSKEKDNDLGGVLDLEDKVVALFGPYKDVFATGDVSFVYITNSTYGDGVKQYLYSLTDKKNIKSDILLYHNKENSLVVATTKPNTNQQYNYQDVIVYKNGNKNIVLTGGFDSFSYNGVDLFASQNVSSDLEQSDVFKIDLSNLKDEKILTKKNIGHEGKFFIKNGVVYISFGVIDFVNDNVSHHIASYDQSSQNLIREIKTNNTK